ncbi:LysR family transcriptional regulator [Nocardia harenae]|uniref:LysR family transcriptional regulator n=1 Tax=Nocardia harenae TaxID=358707 RepID=UPI000835574B|nr:LysR family transcriptional regulator [Nocardia harenae]
MDVHQLRCFLAVVEERHFGRAAERLHLTTSPVSRAVRDLEREIGAQLLVRGPREVTPTAAGARLAARGATVVSAFDALLPDLLAELDAARRVIRVGSSHLTEPDVLDTVVECARKAVPDREVVLQILPPAELSGMVADGVLDLAVEYLPVERPGLRARAVAGYRMGIAMRADDPIAARPGELTVSDVIGRTIQLPSVSVVPVPPVVADLKRQLEEKGARDVRVFPTADVIRLAEHVRRTGDLSLSFVDVQTGATRVYYEQSFRVRRLADGPEMTVGVVWRADRGEEAILNAILAAIPAL